MYYFLTYNLSNIFEIACRLNLPYNFLSLKQYFKLNFFKNFEMFIKIRSFGLLKFLNYCYNVYLKLIMLQIGVAWVRKMKSCLSV